MATVLGFGSLLSERSARSTFPDLQNFRLALIDKSEGYRRSFQHPAGIFFVRGIAKKETLEYASLSCEKVVSNSKILNLEEQDSEVLVDQDIDSVKDILVSAFEIPNSRESIECFYEREEEFRIENVKFREIKYIGVAEPQNDSDTALSSLFHPSTESKTGFLCTKMQSDDEYVERWGKEKFEEQYGRHGITTIWNHGEIYPCRVYLRHCLLAAKNFPIPAIIMDRVKNYNNLVLDNFLDATLLWDKKTSLREYMEKNKDIWDEEVPDEFRERYNG